MTRHSKMRGSYVLFLLVMAFSSIHDFDMGYFSRIIASHRSLSMRPRARRGPIRPIGNCEAVPFGAACRTSEVSPFLAVRKRPAGTGMGQGTQPLDRISPGRGRKCI